MQIKSVIDNIHNINFITFNISTLFFAWFALLKLGCPFYIRASYKPSNTVTAYVTQFRSLIHSVLSRTKVAGSVIIVVREIHYCVVAKVWNCNSVVSEFELQSRTYVHFQTNTVGKGMNTLISLVIIFTNPSAQAGYDTRSIFSGA